MSVIGPRPALWNQDVLIAEREKYNANDVKPGLTGWAQINGRDELEIPVKAKLDGEYVEKLGIWMDIKCFLGTIGVWYAKKHKIPHYLYVQDLWPENVEIVTGIHSPLVLKPIGKMVDYIYEHCDHIFATSPSFVT